ncbi:MAG: hypothetical protein GF398_02375 [Chitinivibrionales bacterium]|nr:hypothetical protein [Chitinivibrionales bacterium]
MKLRNTLPCLILGILLGCAPYKQIKPKPEITPEEKGYLQIAKGDKNFKLKKGKQYYIAFPGPKADNFYLVLSLLDKKSYNSFLLDSYEKKKMGAKIEDESPHPDTVSAYPLEKSNPMYYWMIDDVMQDIELRMRYRYVPKWRYKFETHHASYKETFEKNKTDRTIYNSIGVNFTFQGFNFAKNMQEVSQRTNVLEGVLQELLDIESIFPDHIKNSSDKAYLDFKNLKSGLEEEIAFQKLYSQVLDFFNNDLKTRDNTGVFLNVTKGFIAYFGNKDDLAQNVLKESKERLEVRLREIGPYYDKKMGDKPDGKPLDPQEFHLDGLKNADVLYNIAGIAKPDIFKKASTFVFAYQEKSTGGKAVFEELQSIQKSITGMKGFPDDDFFKKIHQKASALRKKMPTPLSKTHGKYLNYPCSQVLNKNIIRLNEELTKLVAEFDKAAALVPGLNSLKARKDYREMLKLIKQNSEMEFLLDVYSDLDSLSVAEQERRIKAALEEYRWREAEAGLRTLHNDIQFINPESVRLIKHKAVHELEDTLYITVDRVTRYRVDKFLEENVDTLENIDSLYTDSVFLPCYDISFSTGTKNQLYRRKEELVAHLAKMKENEFPRKAIKLLWDGFLKRPSDNGVLKARAIVAHGKHYEGEDQKTQRIIREVDPWTSKWIVKPKEYRRLFALPITDNRRGANTYVFRINIRVKTEAKFPVYDVNIKLPEDIARNAGSTQWYEKMTLNKKLLKNEGRFSITAPTAANNYECQISPMRVEKDKNNYLEVRFKHNSFRVHNISVMVQKPIIKKN